MEPHSRYRQLVSAIESRFAVAGWRAGDVDLWPLASQDLYLELFRQAGGNSAPKPPPLAVRAAASLATPATNLWKSRHDLAHWVARPHRADAIFLGDGVCLDRVGGAWRDRFGEPIACALERQRRTCYFMQSGNLGSLPWARRTYSANQVAAFGALRAAFGHGPRSELPDHAGVLRLIGEAGVRPAVLGEDALARRARTVAAQASLFETILRRVRPAKAFVVCYYAGLGHAFALACRRRGILCVDLQHCPHDGTHRAYRWSALPPHGYSTLPGLFWTWSEADAANIRRWSDQLDGRWHSALAGGHAQIDAMDGGEAERLWQAAVASTGDSCRYEREILVTLQPIGGKRDLWQGIADRIKAAPAGWRWWIRRHPASAAAQDSEYAGLLSLEGAGVVTGAAAQIPLPALLSHMDAQVSLASGAAAEAATLGVPAFFLDAGARETFPNMIARGEAAIVDVDALLAAIAGVAPQRIRPRAVARPIEKTLAEIDRIAAEYAELHRSAGHAQISGRLRP